MDTKERTDTPTRWPLDVHDGETGATVQRVLIALLALGVLAVSLLAWGVLEERWTRAEVEAMRTAVVQNGDKR